MSNAVIQGNQSGILISNHPRRFADSRFDTVNYNDRLRSKRNSPKRESFLRQTRTLIFMLALALCGQAFGLHGYVPRQHPKPRARLHRVHHRIPWNPVFRPSRDSLLRQNAYIDTAALPRIENDEQLEELKTSEELLPIEANTYLRFDPRLDPDRRYCRPWTLDFVNDISEAYYKQFHSQLQVNSAVRTVQVQKKLRRHNRNAAPETGELASSHLAGVTVDLQRRGMTKAQVKWMEQYMSPLKDMGLIEPEEERRQWVFHVMVSDRYDDYRESKMLAGSDLAPDDDAVELQQAATQSSAAQQQK